MSRLFPIRSHILCGLLPFKIFDDDRVSKDSKTAKSFYEQQSENETGWDRLHMMFSTDEFANISPELHSVYQASFLGLFVGACFGGFVRSRLAYMDFMERNQATTFTSHFEAKKKLQDQVTVNFGKGAFQWAWRLGLFSGSYVLITTTISVYRGRSSLLEYVTAGAITGASYKLNLGLRGMLVGGLLGSALGCVAGGISLLLLKTTGMSMEEVRFWQYKWKEARIKQNHKLFTTYKANQEDPLMALHNEKVAASGNFLETDDISSVKCNSNTSET